jgi:DNA-binding GntR family transcriptional regulator
VPGLPDAGQDGAGAGFFGIGGRMEEQTTREEQIFQDLRTRIINNSYKPGTMLVERKICEEYNISRTPIRGAFRRLADAGFVQIIPQKGVFVMEISIDAMIELFELREALEKMAVKLFVQRAGKDILRQVSAGVEEQNEAYRIGDHNRFMKRDMEFHKLIAEGSGNTRLADTICDIYDQISMLAISVEDDAELLNMAMLHHQAIFDAIQRGDADAAETAMMRHIVETKEYHIIKRTRIRAL